MTLRCIAVDDEPLALNMLCTFIQQTPFLELVGKYSSAVEALQGLHQQKAEVIFLDIQMPDLSGLELARILDKGEPGSWPRIVFTTAFNQYAVEGYKVDALDYLLKPFNYADFLRAASKAKAYADLLNKTIALPSAAPEPEEEYLFLKVEYQLVRIAFSDILYIEGLKDYVKVHLESNPKPVLSLSSLKVLEEKLPARRFMRIHRSYIVALDKISAVSRNRVQIGENSIVVSEQYKDTFGQFLSRWT
ncbi:LytTR family DNA-binding domain-containing protein [Cesiribacter sp. SM1]|uniref:LytR/AlgR family response regulator transcription factor n=1 Tax=Cesiribacter sp. SM1 TaxID=2861196 RepID=UPI001CD28A93|nr:LytTR family DNA-binding domain-containing protein [Cesiribacter sp. SM1]